MEIKLNKFGQIMFMIGIVCIVKNVCDDIKAIRNRMERMKKEHEEDDGIRIS